MWLMEESYSKLLIEFRNRLFLGEYDVDILLETVSLGVWHEIFDPVVTNENTKSFVKIGDVRLIQKAIECGCVLKELLLISANYCNLEILKYAYSVDYQYSASAMAVVAYLGCLDCLVFLHENGCPWTVRVAEAAAKGNHLDCLKYAHENGCPWNEYTTLHSAYHRSLNCMKYAHEHGCPWHPETTLFAAKGGDVECLKYAYEHNCPWHPETNSWAVCYNNHNCKFHYTSVIV